MPDNYRTVHRLESDNLRDWENQTVVIQPDEADWAMHPTPPGTPPVDYYGADVFRYAEAVPLTLRAVMVTPFRSKRTGWQRRLH